MVFATTLTRRERLKKFLWRNTVRRIVPLPPPEYIELPARFPTDFVAVGRFLEAPEPEVEVSCTQEQRTAMLARIAANWRHFGETEPHWSVLTDPIFLSETIDDHLDAFFAQGRFDIGRMLGFVHSAGIKTAQFARVLDFGCGVGRLTAALAPHAQAVIGVDISEGHLREARQALAKRGIGHAEFVRIDAIDDIDRLGSFDLILSLIVLQHNPPPIMAAIFAKLLARLRPGGIAIVQMPTFIAGQTFSVARYLAGESAEMEMNALPQREIFRIIAEQGCITAEVREDGSSGPTLPGLSHTFAVVRPG